MLDWNRHPHRRLNPLTREWVLVSPHRTQRPWLGQREEPPPAARPAYDPSCYLCPGNARAGGARNPAYTGTFVFENDFAALRPDTPLEQFDRGGVLVAQGEPGACRVVCFSPDHSRTLSDMPVPDIRAVVDTWVEQFAELAARPSINWVQIFENRGEMMGASNPHPHCQIWASRSLPNEAVKELASQRERWNAGACLLCDYLRLESEQAVRIVLANGSFTALVPFWAVWPFETLLISSRHFGAVTAMTMEERDGLAAALNALTRTYDSLFGVPFPYSMGFHQCPTDGLAHPEWHFHAHFYPPLLRSATVRKFMVGYEMLASPQRDLTPEAAAARLRELAAP